MNMMIRPILPYYSSMTQADGFTIVSMLLLLIGAVFAAFCIAMYAANGQQGEKRKTVLLFMGITAIVTVTMLGFFGCAAVTVRGIILCLILLYSSYSDIRTRECSDYLHLMIVIAAFIGCKTAELPAMILGGVLVGAVMLVPLLTGKRSLGGADIKCSAACAFLLVLKRGLIGLTAGLLLAVIINGIKNRKKKDKSFPLLPYLSVGFTAAYFI